MMKRSLIKKAVFAAIGAFCSITALANVAKVGETEYGTLQAAISAAGANATVELCADVTENITVPAGFTGTIDLGGKTLTGNVQASYSAATTTDFILQNGYIITPAGNTSKGAIFVKNAAVELIAGVYPFFERESAFHPDK